ncbi:ferrous iron transport protein B [Bacteroidia bacterium]|nr:ferrous iron transport protein B [Bacteroidia bacterium]
MRLAELHTGEKGIIAKVMGRGSFRKRIVEMGFIRGKEVEVIQNAPLRDPIHYRIMGYDVSLRRSEAALVEVVSLSGFEESGAAHEGQTQAAPLAFPVADAYTMAIEKGKTINVALVGNPNCGKTTLFNYASGAHEHVGNYGGVTVAAKGATFKQNGYTFRIVDLPGTYSLSAYSPEERYVRKHLGEEHPDVVINVVDASNLERNFYLTTQLIDMDLRMVVALNMYDTLQKQGDALDYESLSHLLGAPLVPAICRTGYGVKEIFDRVIRVYEENDPVVRHIHINYGEDLEEGITHMRRALKKNEPVGKGISKRLLAIRLLEKDAETEAFIRALPNGGEVLQERDEHVAFVESILKEDTETALADARYGFISGALLETFKPGNLREASKSRTIDHFITHRLLGFPIFLFFMWVMFEATFRLGAYPMEWIKALVDGFGGWIRQTMSDGPLKDLLTDGIIGGVGGVVVFLPNILILYLFISFMEDSGYMARAAFIMDKIMHKMGLHGKSFIPLVMGFGCNVPAIMASRTIESRNSRMITMLVNPLMSCSARLPVYVLLTGAFFPGKEGLVMLSLYGTGVLLAVLMARLFKRFLFKEEDLPFVMELPPYRLPTLRSVLVHVWDKGKQYLRKMGGVILVASILIWFLGYFPLQPGMEDAAIREQNSYIGQFGQFIQPVLQPLGFDWKMSVSLLSGMAAKEVVVSTLSVLQMPAFMPLSALSFMLFILIYFPCIATITAIVHESKSWKWGAFVAAYTCTLAWLVSFVVYQTGMFFSGI